MAPPSMLTRTRQRDLLRFFSPRRDHADETEVIRASVDQAVVLPAGDENGCAFSDRGLLSVLVPRESLSGEDEDLVFPEVGVVRACMAGRNFEDAHDEVRRPFLRTDGNPLADAGHRRRGLNIAVISYFHEKFPPLQLVCIG